MGLLKKPISGVLGDFVLLTYALYAPRTKIPAALLNGSF